MRNFHIKSILLGIGIGIILTSIISMIFMAGRQIEISNEDIIQRAKAMGMVDGTDILLSPTKTPGKPSPTKTENKPASTPTEQAKLPEQEVKVLVNKGDTPEIIAGRLINLGLISEKSAFVNELANMGLATKIEIGEFNIKKGTDIKSMIKTLTKQK